MRDEARMVITIDGLMGDVCQMFPPLKSVETGKLPVEPLSIGGAEFLPFGIDIEPTRPGAPLYLHVELGRVERVKAAPAEMPLLSLEQWAEATANVLRKAADARSQSLTYQSLGANGDGTYNTVRDSGADALAELAEIITAMKTVDGIAAFYKRLTGKEMTAEGRAKAAAMPRFYAVCPLGKHKGAKWADVPADYLQWVRRQDDMEADIKAAASEELGRRAA